MEPDRRRGVQAPERRVNWTIIALIVPLVLLVLVIIYFATRGNANQDRLTNSQVSTATVATSEKACASKQTYDLIKRDLFRRAAQLRGSDQAAYDRLAAYAVVRMENPVMESEDQSAHAVNCSGSLALDLPPGVAVAGGRRSLMSDVDYVVQPAADGGGTVVLLRNADAIIATLATLARAAEPPNPDVALNEAAPMAMPPMAPAQPGPTPPPAPAPPPGTRPSFDCTNAHSHGEIAVCSDPGLAALDRNMAAQFARALASAYPEQRAQLIETRDRFVRYRDRCMSIACIGDAYVGRMREIRDIAEGSRQPPR